MKLFKYLREGAAAQTGFNFIYDHRRCGVVLYWQGHNDYMLQLVLLYREFKWRTPVWDVCTFDEKVKQVALQKGWRTR